MNPTMCLYENRVIGIGKNLKHVKLSMSIKLLHVPNTPIVFKFVCLILMFILVSFDLLLTTTIPRHTLVQSRINIVDQAIFVPNPITYVEV